MNPVVSDALTWSLVEGPVEDVYVGVSDVGIAEVLPVSTEPTPPEVTATSPEEVRRALRTGDTSALVFDLAGLTTFQREVLEVTRTIPVGEVRSYGWVAAQIGRPAAVRAVGTALGHNPVSLLIPCHRVVRADGSLGQYGHGPEMKRRLLAFEGADVSSLR